MKKRLSILYQTGTTENDNLLVIKDGKLIVGCPSMGGVFKLVGTHGIPLELVLEKFIENGWIVDWLDYIKDALKDGGKLSNIKSRILSAVGDLHGPKYRDEFEISMNNALAEIK